MKSKIRLGQMQALNTVIDCIVEYDDEEGLRFASILMLRRIREVSIPVDAKIHWAGCFGQMLTDVAAGKPMDQIAKDNPELVDI